jgi:hypothetical protein
MNSERDEAGLSRQRQLWLYLYPHCRLFWAVVGIWNINLFCPCLFAFKESDVGQDKID